MLTAAYERRRQMTLRFVLLSLLLVRAAYPAAPSLYQADFPPAEFKARQARIFDRIGNRALALVPGAP